MLSFILRVNTVKIY